MAGEYTKENSPVNEVEPKLIKYFEARRQTLKAPAGLWSKIECRIEAPVAEPKKGGFPGIAWLFAERMRLFGAMAAVLLLVVVSVAGIWIGRGLDQGGMAPALAPAPPMLASPSPAPAAGMAPFAPSSDQGKSLPQPYQATPPPLYVTPPPQAPAPMAPVTPASPGLAGPPGRDGKAVSPGTAAPTVAPQARQGPPGPAGGGAVASPKPVPQATAPPPAAMPSGPMAQSAANEAIDRQIISSASLSIEVKAVGPVVEQIRVTAESLGGYIEQLSRSGSPEQEQATLTIRVPQDQFSTMLSRLEPLGRVQNQSLRSEDVTAQFIDLDARLKSLQREEESLMALLGKAQNVTDVLNIERELARVRSEIERIQGQLKFLQRRVDLATINVNLFTALQKPGQPPSASLGIETSRVDRSVDSVKALVSSVNGTLDQVIISRRDDRDMATLNLRVFRKDFARVLDTIESQGTVVQKDLRGGATETTVKAPDDKPDAPISVTFAQPEPPKGDWLKFGIPAGAALLVALLGFLLWAAYRAGRSASGK